MGLLKRKDIKHNESEKTLTPILFHARDGCWRGYGYGVARAGERGRRAGLLRRFASLRERLIIRRETDRAWRVFAVGLD